MTTYGVGELTQEEARMKREMRIEALCVMQARQFMSGLITKRISEHIAHAHFIIIILTSRINSDDQMWLMNAVMTRFK